MPEIPNLWPTIDTNEQTPLTILRVQAAKLREQSKGLLHGEITTTDTDKETAHTFFVLAPALEGYKHALFSVRAKKGSRYPVHVSFRQWDDEARELWMAKVQKDQSFLRVPSYADIWRAGNAPSGDRIAATEAEFIEVLKELLGSSGAKGVLSSLVSTINESRSAASPTPTTKASTGPASDPPR